MPILVQTLGLSVKVQQVAPERAYPQSRKKSRSGKTSLRESFCPRRRDDRQHRPTALVTGSGYRNTQSRSFSLRQ